MNKRSIRFEFVLACLVSFFTIEAHAEQAQYSFSGTLNNMLVAQQTPLGIGPNASIDGTATFDSESFSVAGNNIYSSPTGVITYTASDGVNTKTYSTEPGIRVVAQVTPPNADLSSGMTTITIKSQSANAGVVISKSLYTALTLSDIKSTLKAFANPQNTLSVVSLSFENVDANNNPVYLAYSNPASSSISKVQLTMNIALDPDDHKISFISWADFAPNAVLQTATNLTQTNWEMVQVAPVSAGNVVGVSVNTEDGPPRFYRLANTNSP